MRNLLRVHVMFVVTAAASCAGPGTHRSPDRLTISTETPATPSAVCTRTAVPITPALALELKALVLTSLQDDRNLARYMVWKPGNKATVFGARDVELPSHGRPSWVRGRTFLLRPASGACRSWHVDAIANVYEYIDVFHNHIRIHTLLGTTPADFEKRGAGQF